MYSQEPRLVSQAGSVVPSSMWHPGWWGVRGKNLSQWPDNKMTSRLCVLQSYHTEIGKGSVLLLSRSVHLDRVAVLLSSMW